jgi:hypothetical protein
VLGCVLFLVGQRTSWGVRERIDIVATRFVLAALALVQDGAGVRVTRLLRRKGPPLKVRIWG